MRGTRKRQRIGKLIISVGLAALLVFTFTLAGGLGLAGAAPNLDPGVNNGNGNGGVGNGNGNGNKTVTVATVADPTGTTLVPTTFGGNAHLTRFNTASTTETVSGHTVGVFTRQQNGVPTRVCVQHVANGKTVVENFMPFNRGHGSDVFVDVATSTPHIRSNGNEHWQLCAPSATTPVTTTTTTTTTATTTTTTATTATTTTTAGTATTAVSGVSTEVAVVTAAVVTVPGPVLVTQVVAAATALPRAGGVPVLPSVLGLLGLLFSAGGVLLRRYID